MASRPKIVNSIKWLILALVKVPIIMGDSVDDPVLNIERTPPDIFLTLVGYTSAA